MLNFQNISTRTVNIVDHRMINANLAKVIIATTGEMDEEDITESLVDQFDGQGTVVKSSLRKVQDNGVTATYVGFVKSMTEVRDVTPQELQASYKSILASNANVLVNAEDQSIWELKTGAGGKYLVRKSEGDLSQIVASTVNHYAASAKLNSVQMQMPSVKSLVAYVTPEGNLDYGFVTKASTANQCVELVSKETGNTRIVSTQVMAGAYDVEVDQDVHKIAAANISREAKDRQIEYYKALFAYAPDYMEKVIQMVEGS